MQAARVARIYVSRVGWRVPAASSSVSVAPAPITRSTRSHPRPRECARLCARPKRHESTRRERARRYWCAADTQGGGPGPYSAPVAMVVSNTTTSLPHTPYSSDVSRAIVHSWRAGRWFSWAFGVGSSAVESENSGVVSTTFKFARGGNQGSRGGDAGQEFFIEGVLDELDSPAEFFYDVSGARRKCGTRAALTQRRSAAKRLYLWYNASGGTPPPFGSVAVPMLEVLVNLTGTQEAPVVDVGWSGACVRARVCGRPMLTCARTGSQHRRDVPRFCPELYGCERVKLPLCWKVPLCWKFTRHCAQVLTGPLQAVTGRWAARARCSSRASSAPLSTVASSHASMGTPCLCPVTPGMCP